jgi:hypothetical protein
MAERVQNHYRTWAKDHGIEEFTDSDKASRMVFEAGWHARGNPWTSAASGLFLLAFFAYFITLVITH